MGSPFIISLGLRLSANTLWFMLVAWPRSTRPLPLTKSVFSAAGSPLVCKELRSEAFDVRNSMLLAQKDILRKN